MKRSALKCVRVALGLLLPWLPAGAAEGPGFWTTSAAILRFRDEANQPLAPVRIAGNIYHVGAANLAVFLITTPAGHILLDSGFEETVPLIRTNLQRLGFKLEDVKILPFIDPEGYRGFIERAERTFREQVRAERQAS